MRSLQFLAESFRRLTFVHMVNLDHELVEELQPDVVVKIMNERFLIAVPVDDPAKSLAELEAEQARRRRGAAAATAATAAGAPTVADALDD